MGRSCHKRNKKSWKMTTSEFVNIIAQCKPEECAKDIIIHAMIKELKLYLFTKGLEESLNEDNRRGYNRKF